MKNQLAKTST
ncbi:hypothetical protein YPPY59_1065, partial [Yersinia pestis PY-59]